jgi:hypothetical protein
MFESFSDFVNKSSLNEATDITPAKKYVNPETYNEFIKGAKRILGKDINQFDATSIDLADVRKAIQNPGEIVRTFVIVVPTDKTLEKMCKEVVKAYESNGDWSAPAKKIEDYGYANVGYMNRHHNGLDGIAFVQVGPNKKYMNHEASRGFRIPETAGSTHNPSKIYPPRFFVSCFDVNQTKGNILDLLKCAKKGGVAFEIEGAKWVGLFDGS